MLKSPWILVATAALAIGLVTVPTLRNRHAAGEAVASAPSTPPTNAGATCDATGAGKLDFVLKDKTNAPLRVSDYKGKVVLLNFWATWCGPCKEEIPSFVELYAKYKDQGLVILGVSIDDSPEQLQAFTREWKMQYPVAQMQSDIEDAYGPFYGVPTTFFIARDGSICTKHVGPATKQQFEQEIKALL